MKKARNLIEIFIIYCIMGWLYEVIWCNMIMENIGFRNNGFLFGPWLPIYGCGMFIIMAIFIKFRIEKPGQIFVVGTILACLAELIGSYVMNMITGGCLWDYSDEFLNFQGRIALKQALFFGGMILLTLFVVRPRIKRFQSKYDNSVVRNVISVLVITLFFTDLIMRIWLGSNL